MPPAIRPLALVSSFGTAWLLLALVVARAAVLGTPKGSEARGRFRVAAYLYATHLLLIGIALGLDAAHSHLAPEVVVVAGLTATLTGVTLASVILFEGIVRRFKPDVPRIVPDVITAFASFVALMRASSRLGIELSGIIATSAVLTAVIGLALQDTIGNVLGGLALQLDRSIGVGDWVKLGDVVGRIAEIRWRYTALETRDWETVLVPNSVLTKSQVVLLGRRAGAPTQLRRWIRFHVDSSHSPTHVIEVVERALRAQPIRNVAHDPAPQCLLMDFGDDAALYAARYHLTDLAHTDATDSSIRTLLHFALARAGIPFSLPMQKVFVTNEDAARSERERAEDHARRVEALRRIELFGGLSDEEREQLADSFHHAPFARGETMTREGADAHHLYAILSGDVSVRVGGVDSAHEVARLGAGEFFGEMALLTGEPRRATCVAVTEVQCFRLEAEAFRALLERRRDLAEHVAKLLAEREMELRSMRERFDEAERANALAQSEQALASKIRAFFQLD